MFYVLPSYHFATKYVFFETNIKSTEGGKRRPDGHADTSNNHFVLQDCFQPFCSFRMTQQVKPSYPSIPRSSANPLSAQHSFGSNWFIFTVFKKNFVYMLTLLHERYTKWLNKVVLYITWSRINLLLILVKCEVKLLYMTVELTLLHSYVL